MTREPPDNTWTHEVVAELRAEIERLKAENAGDEIYRHLRDEIYRLESDVGRLKKEAWETFEANGDLTKFIAKKDAEIERLTAENARLYALADAAWDEGFKCGDAMARAINDEKEPKP